MAAERMIVEVLYLDGCPHYEALLPRLRALIDELHVDADVVSTRVDSAQAAEHNRFLGSPTVRVNGEDIDPDAAARSDYRLTCRLYPGDDGLTGDVPDHLIRAGLNRADT